MGSGCPVSGCLFGSFLLLVRLFFVVGSFSYLYVCHIYSYVFYTYSHFLLFACVCRRWKLSFHYCVLCIFLACPRFPWVPVASVSFSFALYIIAYIILRSARPSPLYVLILRQLCTPVFLH